MDEAGGYNEVSDATFLRACSEAKKRTAGSEFEVESRPEVLSLKPLQAQQHAIVARTITECLSYSTRVCLHIHIPPRPQDCAGVQTLELRFHQFPQAHQTWRSHRLIFLAAALVISDEFELPRATSVSIGLALSMTAFVQLSIPQSPILHYAQVLRVSSWSVAPGVSWPTRH